MTVRHLAVPPYQSVVATQAARWSSSGGYTVAATGLNGTDLTWCCWAKMVVDRVAYACPMSIDSSGSVYYSSTFDSTREFRHETQSSTDRSFTNIVVGTWYFIAYVARTTGSADLYWKAAGAGSLSTTPRASGGARPAASSTLHLAVDRFGSWINGSIAAVKIWTAALTSTELTTESATYAATRTSNLWANYRFNAGPSTTDSGPSGRTLTAAGAAATTDTSGPPIT